MHVTTLTIPRALRPLAALALLAALSACKTEIIGGDSGGGDGGRGGAGGEGGLGGAGAGIPGTGGVGGNVGGSAVTSVAEWMGMANEIPAGGPPPTDPNTLFVKIGNYGPVCGGSFSFDCSPGVRWQFAVGLPSNMQGPGVYSLANPAVISTSAESGGSASNPGECWAGMGASAQGTIEVLSNDGLTIVVRLEDTGGGTEYSADGQYAVPICQWGLD